MDSTYTNSKISSLQEKQICLYSFNSRGFAVYKREICRLLMLNNGLKIPILCNQENFLLLNNRFIVQQCMPDCHIIFKNAIQDLTYERPKSGMFIAVPKAIKENVKDVSPNHWRIQAIVFSTLQSKILIINAYFPTDPRLQDFDTSDVLSTLGAIDQVLNSNIFDHLIWTGDINADFDRINKFTSIVREFIEERSLTSCWDKYPIDYTHEFEMADRTYTSTIDHFFLSTGIEKSIVDAGVVHLPQNMSDHSPIFCIIRSDGLHVRTEVAPITPTKPSWNKASQEQWDDFKVSLQRKLEGLVTPDCFDECSNVHCSEIDHNQACDDFMITLLKNMDECAKECLPTSGGVKKKNKSVIALWNEEIQPFKDKAMFWHAVWVSAGKPLNTQLHNIMKRTRNVYHYQIRKGKKMTNTLKKNTLLQACIDNRNGDLFHEIKKLRRSSPTTATVIDSECEDIPNHFASVYERLYNSVIDTDEICKIHETLNRKIDTSSLNDVSKITPSVILDAVAHLKNDKSDPIFNFCSSCLKNAPLIFYHHLAALFRSFLIHGIVTSVLLLATLVPILKDKLGDICSSNNYRSIAISSLVLKIFDWVIILLYGDRLELDQLQFSYQPNVSTNMCTWMAVESIDFFTRNGSEVFVCAMDMSKAFDNVKHSLLFRKLITKGLPEIYIRLLVSMYSNQSAIVRWNNDLSRQFPITNGVKQGAVLSAILFCVYVNDLYQILRRKKYGCWINGEYCGIFGYSDDILLLSPSIGALKEMLVTCESFANEHNLQFSTDVNPAKSKTKCIGFVKGKRELESLILCGNMLPWVNNIKHLGSIITNDKKVMANDLMQKRASYINRNNELIQEFHYAHHTSKIKINRIFNTSFYGCVLWDLFGSECSRLEKSWNISHRKMLGLPRESHRYFIEPISKVRHIIFSMYIRFLRFLEKIKSSNKSCLLNLLQTIKYDCLSRTGSNLRKIMRNVGKDRVDDVEIEDINGLVYFQVPEDSSWKIGVVLEMLHHKADPSVVPGLDRDDALDIMGYVCTS